MIHLVIYDITDNRLRKKIETACRDSGLLRVQKSAFRGKMSLKEKEHLAAKLALLTEKDDSSDIQIYPMSAEESGKIVWLSNGETKAIESGSPEAVLIL